MDRRSGYRLQRIDHPTSNSDGMSDLLFQNNDLTPAIWEMNGATAGSRSPSRLGLAH
jgi:hypothetical protein